MGLIMLLEAFALFYIVFVIVIFAIAAASTAVSVIFLIAAAKSPKGGKKRKRLFIFSAVFGVPAVIVIELVLAAPILDKFNGEPTSFGLILAGILAFYIIGLITRRKVMKILLCIPWLIFAPWIIYGFLLALQLPDSLFGIMSFLILWVIITGVSLFIFIKTVLRSKNRMKLVIASNNSGKVREYKQLLSKLGYDVVSQSEAGVYTEVPETGATFEENARLKARAVYYGHTEGETAVIADDSGLEVDYLGGEPGVYSARYAPVGQRRSTVLVKLEGVPIEKRTARFVCVICFIDNTREIIVRGECEGYIGFENRGNNGFGYDSIFMQGGKSFAELTDGEKNAVSHRNAALSKLLVKLNGE